MKAKSPSNGPLLTSPVHRGPKIKFSQKKIVFLPQELLDDFLWGFGVWSHNWKRKKKEKEKKKQMKKNMED